MHVTGDKINDIVFYSSIYTDDMETIEVHRMQVSWIQ